MVHHPVAQLVEQRHLGGRLGFHGGLFALSTGFLPDV